jgi:hypothetical protein
MARGVHDLKMLGENEGQGGHHVEGYVDGAATKDELNLTVCVNGNIRERLKLIYPGLALDARHSPFCIFLQILPPHREPQQPHR